MKSLKVGGTYQHYKGSKVKVLLEAVDSEALKPLVIYLHLEDGYIWARPKEMFLGNVKVNGKTKPRFTLINQQLVIKPKE
jgi:hypothetical protein